MEERIRELERQLGRNTLEVEILKEALDKVCPRKPTWLAPSPVKDGGRWRPPRRCSGWLARTCTTG
jgi:transposase